MSTEPASKRGIQTRDADLTPKERLLRSALVLTSLFLVVLFSILAITHLQSIQSVSPVSNTAAPTVVLTPLATSAPTPQPTSEAAARQAAETAIRAQYASFLSRPLLLVYAGRAWTPTRDDLGVELHITDALAGKADITFNQEAIRRYLQSLAPRIDEEAVDAQISLDSTTAITTSARLGQQLQIEPSLELIERVLATGTPSRIELDVQPVLPRLADADVAAAQAMIQVITSSPFTIAVDERTFVWQPEDVAALLVLQREPRDAASDKITLTLDANHLAQHVDELARASNRRRINPRVAWNGGALQITREGTPGRVLDEGAAATAITSTLLAGERTVALTTAVVQPEVTADNVSTLGIRDVVAVGKSDFAGSAPYRITNIGVGMKKFNGVLIAPDEEFSFNNTVGEINAENGFVEGYAIIENRTQLEFGGGICQVSTTVFRAAFWAGLPITERREHSFYINWYDKYGLGPQGNGPGLDAAIFTGVQDLKFVNDTGNWLLLETTFDPKKSLAQVTLYGTKPNRTVSITQEITERTPAITEPVYFADSKQPRGTIKRTDTARGGMKIEVYRTITDDGQARAPELFHTSFAPWADKYAVNPADLGSNGKPNLEQSLMATPEPVPEPTSEAAAQPSADPLVQPTADPNTTGTGAPAVETPQPQQSIALLSFINLRARKPSRGGVT